MNKAWIALLTTLAWALSPMAVVAAPPPVTLADVYHGNADLSAYWVSEKYDGVRGYWDGERLLTRGGNGVAAPAWFTKDWPDTPMDGELWAGYGKFSQASVIVRTAGPKDIAWHKLSYRVFDLPEHGGDFNSRIPAINKTVAVINQPWVIAVKQFKVENEAALEAGLERVMQRGGEGLMLHRGNSHYRGGRGVGLLKVKPYEDAEARVIGINPGQGRLQGLMGSIEVRNARGQTFALGTGFSDEERANPPPIGAWVTYRFNGRTANGLPRFARFLRLRPGGPPPSPVSENSPEEGE